MGDKVIQAALLAAAVALAIGVIARLTETTIGVSARSWHMFVQTCLLFAIAWGIAQLCAKRS